MKKLISILFVFALFSAYTFAQTATVVSHVMAAGETYYEYTPTKAQYIGGAAGVGYDTLYFEILTNKNGPVNCNARVEVATEIGDQTYDINLQGKIFANGTYATIIAGAGKTATFELLDTTRIYGIKHILPTKYYRYYRVIVNNDNVYAVTDSLTLSKIIFKLYER